MFEAGRYIMCAAAVTAAVALFSTVYWLGNNWHATQRSAVVRTLWATIPGFALCIQFTYRLSRDARGGEPVYDWSTVHLTLLWILVAPVLLLTGVRSHSRAGASLGAGLVQAGHVLFWIASSLLALLCAAAV